MKIKIIPSTDPHDDLEIEDDVFAFGNNQGTLGFDAWNEIARFLADRRCIEFHVIVGSTRLKDCYLDNAGVSSRGGGGTFMYVRAVPAA